MRRNVDPIDWAEADWFERIGHMALLVFALFLFVHVVAVPFIGLHAAITGHFIPGAFMTIMGLLLWAIIALLQVM